MKKLFLVAFLFLLSACADMAPLGYTDNIGVFYNTPPKGCEQISMVLLSSGPWTSYLENEIERLREHAKEIGGNYVDIKNYDYQAGITTFNTNHMTAIIYHCPTKQ